MFKLPSQIPTADDSIETLTDYLEFECVKEGEISFFSKIKQLLLSNDEITIQGTEDETDEAYKKMDEITQEIERRKNVSDGHYPFELHENGYKLVVQHDTLGYWVYLYLLLSTRLNMKADKIHNNIDGTKVLEYLSAEVVRVYFGERSQSFVFGTAEEGSFAQKIKDLCAKIGEGGGFVKRGEARISQKDDKLDVVVWIDFQDKYWSKLIGFGQCKTGTTFDDQDTIELQPDDFCKKWFVDLPIVRPLKMFFCSQNYPIHNYSKVVNAGLVFDRMRLMSLLPSQINPTLLNQIQSWCIGALDFLQQRSTRVN
jgi:hypothetical protein